MAYEGFETFVVNTIVHEVVITNTHTIQTGMPLILLVI